MEKNKVGIVLVNYNGAKYNSECINSIKESTYKNYEIIFVDNNSTDNSVELLEKEHSKDIILIKSKENLGFSKGNNLGIKRALENGCEYIMLLNNDTIIEKDMLEIMMKEAVLNNYVISPKIYYYDNRDMIWSAGAEMLWKKGIPSQFGIGKMDSDEYSTKKVVEIATGCCLLFSKDILEKVGYLSDEYFLYYEDTDFTTKITRSGNTIVYLPEAKMYHKVSASTGGEESENYIYYNTRNRLIYNYKFNKKNLNTAFAYFYLTRVVKVFLWFIKGKNHLIKATMRGIKDFNKYAKEI